MLQYKPQSQPNIKLSSRNYLVYVKLLFLLLIHNSLFWSRIFLMHVWFPEDLRMLPTSAVHLDRATIGGGATAATLNSIGNAHRSSKLLITVGDSRLALCVCTCICDLWEKPSPKCAVRSIIFDSGSSSAFAVSSWINEFPQSGCRRRESEREKQGETMMTRTRKATTEKGVGSLWWRRYRSGFRRHDKAGGNDR